MARDQRNNGTPEPILQMTLCGPLLRWYQVLPRITSAQYVVADSC